MGPARKRLDSRPGSIGESYYLSSFAYSDFALGRCSFFTRTAWIQVHKVNEERPPPILSKLKHRLHQVIRDPHPF